MEPPSCNTTDCLDEKYPTYRYAPDVFFISLLSSFYHSLFICQSL